MASRSAYNREWYLAHKPDQIKKKLAYRQTHPQQYRDYQFKWNLKTKFNITPEQYNVLLETQNGRCLVCAKHRSELTRNLAVDHDHKTGRIRGLLCDNCNVGLGHFKDSIESLKRAISYLESQRA